MDFWTLFVNYFGGILNILPFLSQMLVIFSWFWLSNHFLRELFEKKRVHFTKKYTKKATASRANRLICENRFTDSQASICSWWQRWCYGETDGKKNNNNQFEILIFTLLVAFLNILTSSLVRLSHGSRLQQKREKKTHNK